MYTGIGYDIHVLRKGRALVLGGVNIPHKTGLLGHSDADVLLHAICDAVLGAAGLKDIGYYFPVDDKKYEGISSLKLLGMVKKIISRKGYRVNNVDSVLIAESPKISPYADRMKHNIARELGIIPARVGIKATTNEGVGQLGQGKAIAAHAVASLRKR